MDTHGRLERPLAAVAGAVLFGLVVAACDSSAARSPVGPSPARAGAALVGSSSTGEGQLLAAIRRSTAKYQNIDAALADGYIDDGFGCIDAIDFGLDPSAGGMGFHLINWPLHDDPATDPERPDLLVYEPAPSPNGKPKLVALEYEVFTADWYAAGNSAPPSLLGHEFEHLVFPGFDIFALHLWLWRDNPSGMFSDFNPKVSMCQ